MWPQADRGVGEDWVAFGTQVQFSGYPTCFSCTLNGTELKRWVCDVVHCYPPTALVWKPVPAPCFLSVHIHSDKRVLSSSKAQTSLTGRSASSKSRGGSGMWGSKLLRRRHGDSSELVIEVTGGWHITLPDASPAGIGVLVCGCDWAVAAGSWSARCPTPGCEHVPHVTAAPRSE